jgi:hypothetical protein
MLNATS